MVLAIMGLLNITVAAKIGRAALAAFLKKSRLDWSSSFFFCSFILLGIKAYDSQGQRDTYKKRRGSLTLLILNSGLGCHHKRISNAASPRQG